MNFNDLPKTIKIMDTTYKVDYVNSPIEVDGNQRQPLFGQIDYWNRTIRILKKDRTPEDVWQTLWHECVHGICEKMKILELHGDEDKIDKLATGINSIMVDNFMKNIN